MSPMLIYAAGRFAQRLRWDILPQLVRSPEVRQISSAPCPRVYSLAAVSGPWQQHEQHELVE
eukprot:2701075-Heterocapsa_arctica.AAC.1